MKRKIESHPAVIVPVATDGISDDVKEWLRRQAAQHGLKWLLAHADDGVIWGRMDNGKLVTSNEVAKDKVAREASSPLRLETLLEARLFAPHGELLFWRDGENRWRARLIRNANQSETPSWYEAVDESQILWGTDAKPLSNGFTLMTDGVQGLRHVVPVEVKGNFKEESRPLRLWVRHYVAEDEDGFTRIVVSRLLELKGLEGVK
ncbi:MAG: CRISPR-associated protein Csx19 [Bacillota bacterium]